jgi:hypothetical protein
MTPSQPSPGNRAAGATEETLMPANRMLRGAFTALVTPFQADGSIEEATFRALVRRQIDSGIHGLVACGTTGETPTLSHEEDEWVIGTTLEVAAERPSRDRLRIVAGTGSNSTATAIRSTRRAAAMGVDAALVVAPYYNKPDQRMLEAHFRAVAEEGDLPIIVYNVPGRTGVNVEAATLLRLAEHPRIVAVKEASANMDQIATILRDRPAGFRRSRRRRHLDAADAGHGRRRGDLHLRQRDPRPDGGDVRRRVRRRLGHCAPDTRALAAADEGQLCGRPEPGAGQGGAGHDGPDDGRGEASSPAA